MQQKSERVTMVKKSDCHSKIVTVDRYAVYMKNYNTNG